MKYQCVECGALAQKSASGRCPNCNGLLEGVSNKVRTLQRTAYGYRDQQYFRLTLHALHITHYALIG